MRMMTVTLALGTVVVLSAAAAASPRVEVRPALHRPVWQHRLVIVPVVRRDPYWIPDYNIVPRYRYRPEDDRVDTSPYAPPVAPGDVEPGGFGIGQ
ncbi:MULTISPECIES: hypothetical protein [unclassified Bradyrhizobium]|uniref:hypothetical protein n=1 Tax=unclassified Bradyrhizobium TaxID=2631580 RepID=UPI0028E1C81C|nr:MULTISPECIES: hypothetical protein [unclassified Bradyrhizobium]